jgi:hypothetical protein
MSAREPEPATGNPQAAIISAKSSDGAARPLEPSRQ